MKKILIIEDEKDIARMIDYNLKKEGYSTVLTHDGPAGVAAAARERPDLVILDLMLPGLDGLEVCRRLKKDDKTSGIAIIMLTAKSGETDRVVGLEMGADDYVAKPFSVRELLARVKAVLRRVSDKNEEREIYRSGDLLIDSSKVLVLVKNRPIELTAKEFELLRALVKAKGRVVSREGLLDLVWGIDAALELQTRTVDVHIMTLRKKLKSEGGRIVTVKNYGYRFET
ncbi:MAG: DNA-binding response regulator [Elusimicrobia bacterium RIFOXYA12_FULL_51_18]|nr:MAG: DNA-binding response regulator [Elusimicrobia bacterium RIFOXYA12_FULL_51_18]OGS32446.1 MAG: DNA-binding response regulator [Elusimicrobia bacterium RIFOXYA2_FULL_53_38]